MTGLGAEGNVPAAGNVTLDTAASPPPSESCAAATDPALKTTSRSRKARRHRQSIANHSSFDLYRRIAAESNNVSPGFLPLTAIFRRLFQRHFIIVVST